MELQDERVFDVRERIARKWVLALFVLVIALGLPAIWLGPQWRSSWQQERLLRKARLSLIRNEAPSAAIFLRRVLILNPDNVEATRTMADLAETYLPGEAAALRERVCQLAPNSYPDATKWALTALRLGQIAQAEEAFERMKKLGQPSLEFHEIGARVALAAGSVVEARAGFARALEFEPSNDRFQLELAAIDLRASDSASQQRARATMERLRAIPALRPAALRALIADRLERSLITEAAALARDFASDPEATFQDRLQYLGNLRAMEDPSFVFISSFDEKNRIPLTLAPGTGQPGDPARETTFASYLNDLKAEAAGNAGKVASLVSFLNSRGLPLLACEWTRTMAREFVSVPPVAPPMAEARCLTRDWQRLEEFIAEQDWGEVDFLRFAYRSRVAQEKGDRGGAAAHWTKAINLAEYRHERLVALARLASGWGWSGEYEEILWLGARNSRRPREALKELAEVYRRKRDTPKLFTVWSRLLELDPADVTARKNWVRLSLLLGNERYRTGNLAHELYQEYASDPEIATSYALVLHFREQEAEALAVMRQLTPEQLREPAVAGYYGIVLFANQQKQEAAEFLARAAGAPLLREEQELIAQTRHALERSRP